MTERKIRDAAFAKRLTRICDESPNVPAHNHGRLSWIKKQLSYVDVSVSTETARKWLSGEARPRPAKMRALAKLLDVDLPYISLGVEAKPNVDAIIENERLRLALRVIYCAVAFENDNERAAEIAKAALSGAAR